MVSFGLHRFFYTTSRYSTVKKGRRSYDEAVRRALIVLWEAADRI